MEYCRQLKFEEDPDYKHIVGLFEKCLTRNNLDHKLLDFTWKQNRLSKDKEALKNSVLNVIKKKAKVLDMDQPTADDVSPNYSFIFTMQNPAADLMKQTMGGAVGGIQRPLDQGYALQ